ncbi:MAG: filamentous hemagglutinin N-terminal domain-containing protein [Symploca sp. SIO2E6]|nr:filamentous hemagglutinin N-terminal domain-containing protein [Symploca sp. SIO2E6]
MWLLNPNGINFGLNASLDVRGSFVASTTDEISLGPNGVFSATNPQDSQLLNVQPGVLLDNNRAADYREIKSFADLGVPAGQTLSLQGGVVEVSGSLTAPGGKVEVLGNQVGLLGNAKIDVSAETGGEVILKAEGKISVTGTLLAIHEKTRLHRRSRD